MHTYLKKFFHFRVRDKNKFTDKFVKMSLQLYQVDYKSYLLDFKSLTDEESEVSNEDISPSPVIPPINDMSIIETNGHHTMEFFEMCAALIIQLAR